MNTDTADRLTAKGLPVFQLETFELNQDMKIPMSMTQAIESGILDTSTAPKIQAFSNCLSKSELDALASTHAFL